MKKPVCWMLAIMTENEDEDVLATALVTVAKTLAVRLEFTLPEEGKYELLLYVDCDAYMGLDQTIRLDEIVVRS
jgi:pre-mRNA-splicing helicase BRR2